MRTKTLHMLCAIIACSFTALADDGHGNNGNKGNNGNNDNGSFESGVIGSAPGTSVGGVGSGGAPWAVQSGEASISSSGRVHVEVHGLLLAAGVSVGTVGPVTMVGASLICGGSGGTVVPETGGVVSPSPLSTAGNAEIDQAVNLPATCIGPVVLVRVFNSSAPVGSQLTAFIAGSGLAPNAPQKQNQNGDGGGHDR